MAGGRLPAPADAGHVCVELAGEAAAGSSLQERGPDGRLEQLPPVLVEFWKTAESVSEEQTGRIPTAPPPLRSPQRWKPA